MFNNKCKIMTVTYLHDPMLSVDLMQDTQPCAAVTPNPDLLNMAPFPQESSDVPIHM